ncbi:MAG TPA: BTAD domain-containing putative transcriptional regulator [Solirubrobacteraceae bacterium]|nr:BTAD domain-containing putative transcriptional regulator [Solirubrobacteraceae bacterium]
MEVWHGEQRLALGGPRQLALFAFLVLHANRAVSRDALIDALWGPARTDADNRLQMAVARLRKSLEPVNGDGGARLQTVKGGYLLTVAPGELDADTFHAAVHAGARALEASAPEQATRLLTEALDLWRGPPLAEVAFDDFAQPEIRRLEELRIRALECRVDAQLAMGRHAEVIGELESLLIEAPTREHTAGQLMLALYRCGRQADALYVYQRVRAALAQELGLEPGPALRTLQVEILEQAASLDAPTPGTPRPSLGGPSPRARTPMPTRLRPYGPTAFAGRERELAALRSALAAAASSGRQAAFVTGEAGIGKTRIVSELARGAHDDGVLVLGGRCDDGLGLPYQPFVEVLEHLVAHASAELLERHIAEYGESVARLVPELSARAGRRPAPEQQSGDSERYVLFRAIEGFLAEVCEAGPVLLVLEDLHWADVPTLTLLRRILTSPREWPLMILSTSRVDGLDDSHALRELLADLHREPNVLRVNLTGLGSGDVVELLRGMPKSPEGGVDDELAATLETGTNGNPFFIIELVRSLSESGALELNEGRLGLPHGVELAEHLPASITETLGQRVRRMDEAVRGLLDVGAVVGDEFDLDLVSQVAQLSAAAESAARAVRSGVLIEVPGGPARFRFVNALMQRYLYRELGRRRRTGLHREVAVAMEARAGSGAAPIAEVARHWLEAVDAELESAFTHSILAGDDALEKLAPDQARSWYEASLDLLSRFPGERESDRCELLIKRGEAERQAGDLRFRVTLLEAAHIARGIGDPDKLVRAALANSRGMQSETGVVDQGRMATLDSALAIVGHEDSSARARLLAIQAAELMYSDEWERRVRLSDEALAIARRLDDVHALSSVLSLRFVTLLAPGTLPERQANAAEAVAAAERLNNPLVRFYAYHWRTYACIEAGEILAARSWSERERDIAERFREPTSLWLRRADEANLAIIAGDLDVADQLSAEALEIGRRSEPDALACFAAQQASIAFERGTVGELAPMLAEAVRQTPGVPGFRATLALALVEAGRGEEARRLLEQAIASSFPDTPHDIAWLTVACIYAHVAASLEDPAAAAVLYRALDPFGEQVAFPAFGVWGPVGLYLGSLALVLGDPAGAEHHLQQAARIAMRAGAPIWEARAVNRLGRLAEPAR